MGRCKTCISAECRQAVQASSGRQKQASRRSQLRRANTGFWLTSWLRWASMKAGFILSDHTRNALILAVFAFKVGRSSAMEKNAFSQERRLYSICIPLARSSYQCIECKQALKGKLPSHFPGVDAFRMGLQLHCDLPLLCTITWALSSCVSLYCSS